jgi:2-methylisocitrate lyase-like PEP mutase family enzyme
VAKILKAGAIGINIEDGLFGGKRQLVSPDQHAAKIKQRGTLRKNSEFVCSSMRERIRFC